MNGEDFPLSGVVIHFFYSRLQQQHFWLIIPAMEGKIGEVFLQQLSRSPNFYL